MISLLIISSFLVIFTKFLDCWTTQRWMSSPAMERNRWARTLMMRYGKGKVIWGVFTFTVLLTGLMFYLIMEIYSSFWQRVAYIIMALAVAGAQFFVALANYQQRHNWFTKKLSKWKLYA